MAADNRKPLALAWQAMALQRGWRAWLLRPVAALYGAVLALRRQAYERGLFRTERLDVPVIVVGNVVVGGAGKTPAVMALVQALRERGWTPGIISRGHGRTPDPAPLAVLDNSRAEDVGDEPLQIRRATGAPVFVAQRRIEAGRALRKQHPEVDVIITDDGLQHWALHRDVTVVVMDDRGVGNGWLLPAGLLREPWPPKPHRRPDVVLQQRPAGSPTLPCPMPEGVPRFEATRSLSPLAINALGEKQNWAEWSNTRVNAVAGVARPEVFFDMLRQGGLLEMQTHPLSDHAAAADYVAVWNACPNGPLLCTDKDAVKLFALPHVDPQRVWRVPLVLNSASDWTDVVLDALPTRL